MCILQGILSSLCSLILIIFPLYFLNNLTEIISNNIFDNKFLIVMLIAYVSLLILITLSKGGLKVIGEKINLMIKFDIAKDSVDVKYDITEDVNMTMKREKVLFPIENQNVIPRIIVTLSDIISYTIQIFCIVLYIGSVNIFLIFLPLVTVYINFLFSKKMKLLEQKSMEKIIPLNREFGYYLNVAANQKYAKDIRLYKINQLISKKLSVYQEKSSKVFRKLLLQSGRYKGVITSSLYLQALISCVGIMVVYNKMTLSVGVITSVICGIINLNTIFSKIVLNIFEYGLLSKYIEAYFDFRKMLNLSPNSQKNEIDEVNIVSEKSYIESLEVKNLSFKYSGLDTSALDNINMKFQKGKVYSIVGTNGAGKTTLVKILSSLYDDYSVDIYINGGKKAVVNEVSCVFQDFKIFPLTIMENIVLGLQNVEERDVFEYIEKLGMTDMVKSSKYKLDTFIGKNLEKDGISLSGGQAQRLAIIRSLINKNNIIIMDEPTSAIDPLLEYEIYSVLQEMKNDCDKESITIFISHRLASCKFSDYIYVMDEGKLVQEGSFDSLKQDGDGLFSEMWTSQSKYYVG